MADRMWSFLTGFTVGKYYEAAQSGDLIGAAPFSFGAVFSLKDIVASNVIFGNAVFGTSGAGLRINSGALLNAANGTISQLSGTALANADGTYGQTPEGDLINNYKSSLMSDVGQIAGAFAWPTPRADHIVHIHVNVPASGNQSTYVNSRLVAATAVGLVTNANPFRIGVGESAANPAAGVLLAGCYYNNAVLTAAQVATIFRQSTDAKDCAGADL